MMEGKVPFMSHVLATAVLICLFAACTSDSSSSDERVTEGSDADGPDAGDDSPDGLDQDAEAALDSDRPDVDEAPDGDNEPDTVDDDDAADSADTPSDVDDPAPVPCGGEFGDCPESELCVRGFCNDLSCEVDADCADVYLRCYGNGEIQYPPCVSGQCSFTEELRNSNCPEGLRCVTVLDGLGECVPPGPPCVSVEDCPPVRYGSCSDPTIPTTLYQMTCQEASCHQVPYTDIGRCSEDLPKRCNGSWLQYQTGECADGECISLGYYDAEDCSVQRECSFDDKVYGRSGDCVVSACVYGEPSLIEDCRLRTDGATACSSGVCVVP